MMRTPDRPLPRRAVARHGRRAWIAVGLTIVALAAIWSGLWYYAAAIVEQTLAGWYQREAAAGRNYSCGSQTVGGFPLKLAVRCDGVAVDVKSAQPAFSVAAKTATFGAMIWQPTTLVGEVGGPLTFAELGQAARFRADWNRGQMTVRGIPPNPESASLSFETSACRSRHRRWRIRRTFQSRSGRRGRSRRCRRAEPSSSHRSDIAFRWGGGAGAAYSARRSR